jgi:invasion protein IalB
VKDGREESGRLVVAVAIFEKDGDQHKLLRLTMPYGVVLQPGTRLIVDQEAPATAPYVTCLPPETQQGGCIADYEATPDLIAKMKKGQYITAQAIHANSGPMSPQLELKDFGKVYDGPPTDPKVIAEQQTKMRDEMQKRADELRKKIEAQQPAAATGQPPAR